MEIFSIDPATYGNGNAISGIDSVLWVERYRDAGEFTITGEPNADLRAQLFIGQMISHTDTQEVMMVESHEIDETKDGPPVLVVTGRSVEAIAMENRVMNPGWFYGYKDPTTNDAIGTTLLSDDIWDQIQHLMGMYMISNPVTEENYPNLSISQWILRPDPNATNRFIPIGILYDAVKDLLASFDGGIKTLRPDTISGPYLRFVIHEGHDKRQTVQFNYLRGDVERARYLWTIKNVRNKAYVRSQYYGILVDPADILGDPDHGWGSRIMHVDFNELSDYYTGGDPAVEAEIANMLFAVGWNTIKATGNNAFIVDATISPASQFRYRVHYNLGDVVWVSGNYGAEAAFRVTEYAESYDKNGASGIPTLTAWQGYVH